MHKDPIVITSIARTAIGNLLGELQPLSAHQLGTHVIKAALSRAALSGDDIDEVMMGCVLPAGQGQAPARQSALNAGIPDATPCTTLNKVCGSGMKTIMIAHDLITVGTSDIMVAGGMESMTNAPYLLLKARQGYRLGHNKIYDHMMLDGLEDAYEPGKAMGCFADQCAIDFKFSREQQDDYSIQSLELAREANENGAFTEEIIPISYQTRKGDVTVSQDEKPFSVSPAKIPKLKAAFSENGSVTAGNSSSIADGAAAVTLMRASLANSKGIRPLVRIVGHASAAKAPEEFTTAPIDATRKLLSKLNWQAKDVDLFEVNEAFAVVALAFMKEFNLPREKVNIHGGACALGHPIGASGTRIVVTLISAMKQKGLKKGIATLCIGGGEATAIAVELME